LIAGGWFVLREKYRWLISQTNRALVVLDLGSRSKRMSDGRMENGGMRE
jgi:hypothetical protein